MRASPVLAILLAACGVTPATDPGQAIGDPRRGRALVRTYGCDTCHVIPGVATARATVGPPLDGFARRVYAGGRVNSPDYLVEFLVDPTAVRPMTPMPAVGLDRRDARDIAAFLYSLH